MLTTAGYVWTIVPVKRRKQYMEALQRASTYQNITPLAGFIAELITQQTAEPLVRE
jgi:hypothetical protein